MKPTIFQRLLALFCICLSIVFAFSAKPIPHVHGQQSALIDVYLEQDRDSQQVRVYFTNSRTGLSSVATVDNFSRELNVLDEFTLAANGVIFRSPVSPNLQLISPNGNIVNLDFIPQQPENLLRIEWAISPNGRMIAWAELFFQNNAWQATMYVAQIDGSNLRQLPPLPIPDTRTPRTRIAMIAVSDNGNRVFFDLEHPTEQRDINDYFINYWSVWAYLTQRGQYDPLPTNSSGNCFCAGQIGQDSRTYVRLEEPVFGTGYSTRFRDLDDLRRDRRLSAFDTQFTQAGDILINDTGTRALYTMARLGTDDEDNPTTFALVLANVDDNSHRIIATAPLQHLKAIAFINNDQEAIVVDRIGNVTYKLNIDTGELIPVASLMWIGILEG
jgi:hypothetical protein